MDTLRKMIVGAAMIGLLSCAKQRCDGKTKLVFLRTTPVMSKAYPRWYKTMGNEVVTTMYVDQSLSICSFIRAKDFAVYEVRLSDGRKGYVEYDPIGTKEVGVAQKGFSFHPRNDPKK